MIPSFSFIKENQKIFRKTVFSAQLKLRNRIIKGGSEEPPLIIYSENYWQGYKVSGKVFLFLFEKRDKRRSLIIKHFGDLFGCLVESLGEFFTEHHFHHHV